MRGDGGGGRRGGGGGGGDRQALGHGMVREGDGEGEEVGEDGVDRHLFLNL